MEKAKLTDYQAEILGVIANNPMETISYHKPQMQLGNVVENKDEDETSNALRSLEGAFGVLKFDPKLKFSAFSHGGYQVDLDEARKLYASYLKERKH